MQPSAPAVSSDVDCVVLLGDARDPVCAAVGRALTGRGERWRLAASLAELGLSLRLERLGPATPHVTLRFEDGLTLVDSQLRGLLVRSVSGFDPAGWDPDDLEYASSESRAALIAWIWSLRCPVINRCRPEHWHRGQTSALAWQRELDRAGLALKPHSIRCGDSIDVQRGLPAQALMAPATGAALYAVRDAAEWSRLRTLAALMPLTLTPLHGERATACVVCGTVVWAADPAPAFAACEPGLLRLAAITGMDCFETALVAFDDGPCVESVNPWAGLAGFDEAAREQIGERIARALTEPHRATLPAYEEAAP